MHTHIDTRVRLPEDCPSCNRLWNVLADVMMSEVQEELHYARGLLEEYGEDEMLRFLTNKADYFQREKWRRGNQ